ncbi:MAG: hypothetical protein RLZZ324_408, partial [Candidatus Parcubacteria bacterium]
MTTIALIHGYAVGLTAGKIRPGLGASAGFFAFDGDVRDGTASVFRWGLERDVRPWNLCNPAFILRYYFTERAMAVAARTHADLRAYLERGRPTVIVAHSMGTLLLRSYAKSNPLPASVRAIVFVQSDLAWDDDVDMGVPITNAYCPWDPTLLASSITHLKLRAGLRPMRSAKVTNVMLPLRK